jgi:thiamine biosynthesis protein ThiI
VRSIYEKILLRMVQRRLLDSGIAHPKLTHVAGRIYIHTPETERAARSAARIFGISSTSPGVLVKSGLDEIVNAGTELARDLFTPGTFAVRCRRVGNHPYTSQQVSSALGAAIIHLGLDLKVDLDSPSQVLSVEVRDESAIVYSATIRGPDGFPLGTQDTFVGIIDETSESLLASWCMMKRGCALRAMVLAGQEGPSERALLNLRMLADWVPEGLVRATVVPLAEADPSEHCMMQLHLATELAAQRGIDGVVSGVHPRSLRTVRAIMGISPSIFLPLLAMDDELLAEWSRVAGIVPANFSRYDDEVPLSKVPPGGALRSILSGARDLKIRP